MITKTVTLLAERTQFSNLGKRIQFYESRGWRVRTLMPHHDSKGRTIYTTVVLERDEE